MLLAQVWVSLGRRLSATRVSRRGTGKANAPFFGAVKESRFRGWKLDGKKDKKAWEGDNPKKETYKLWVQFIKDNYENGGWQAGLEGAPDFDDYKDRARKGAGP